MAQKRISLGPSIAKQTAAFDRMMDRYRRATLDWRAFLTDLERQEIEAADAAKAEWERLNKSPAGIVNRAIKRATHAANRKIAAPAGKTPVTGGGGDGN